MIPAMPDEASHQQAIAAIRRKYAQFAPSYDRLEGLPDRLFVAGLRRQLASRAAGHVLEVGVGTGRNLPHYPPDCAVTGVDVSEAMLAQAQRRASSLDRNAHLCQMDAEALAFSDNSFDTVLSSLSLCTVPDPLNAVREMVRVCRPQGSLLFLEHVRSPVGWIGWLQDRLARRHFQNMCCRLNQDTPKMLRTAGLEPVLVGQRLFGVFIMLEARPG